MLQSHQSHEDDEYWAEDQQIAFNFEDEDAVYANKTLPIISEKSNIKDARLSEIKSIANTSISSRSVLQHSQSVTDMQIKKCLNEFEQNLNLKVSNTSDTQTDRSPKEVIRLMIKGVDVILNHFKGKEAKLELLDYALESNDGNVITSVVLFLQRTLKPAIFNYELSKRSVAADHYVHYLLQMDKNNELIDLLAMLGRHEEAAIALYKQSINSNNTETKLRNLKSCVQSHFTTGGSNIQFLNSLITEQISLLERQLPIEMDDSRQEREALNPIFNEIPRFSIINLPVIQTLYYCCVYHYDLSENHLASPKSICKFHHLNQKQFIWTSLLALAKCKRWLDIDSLFEYKSWLGSKKVKSYVPFEKVVLVLKRNDAEHDMIIKYLDLIDDNDIKINTSKELDLHRIAIDTLVKMKDRKRLEEYASKMSRQTDDYAYAMTFLKMSNFKWKN